MWKNLSYSSESLQAQQLAALIGEADALVVGIGAGMSAADGFTYIGPRFENAFPDFIDKYGFLDMLQASLFDFEDWQEYWAFQSRFVALNYLDQPVGQSYLDLLAILHQKDYHIITTNADNAFWAANYDSQRLFHIQGEYGLWQCSQYCHAQTYRDDSLIRQMIAEQRDMKVPEVLIPRCPKCASPFEINKRHEKKGMVEDSDFWAQQDRYENFLAKHEEGKVIYLEIGVGHTTPQFIKHPFWQRVADNPDALFVTLNHKDYRLPLPIRERTVQFKQDIASLTAETRQLMLEKEAACI
ncbi:SIR2 family NAD-dependent protein deacylase [Streptococcus cuniculipharyngis]|uniref:NAD-dependent deacetylase n=1 Tax=Streptococcus cuniculipharyngis TaxID=1562651 RepID=A0A5C5SFP2_9STRE|nr:NAD-dependent deacetylase [Streptococcus cuniculipharyngis]TWS98825.1 NAD-dependent deacetylase [Streptococcus cuniculipharyngis]